MSWDVWVFDFGNSPLPSQEGLLELMRSKQVPVMGLWQDLRSRIRSVLGAPSRPEVCDPGIVWRGPLTYHRDGYMLEFPDDLLKPEQAVAFFAIAVRGHGDPLPDLVKLAKAYGWTLLDGSTFEFLDLDAPSRAGWQGFQSFCKKPLSGPADGTNESKS